MRGPHVSMKIVRTAHTKYVPARLAALRDDTVGKECKDVDYAEDVEAWIGQRAAFGGVELDKGKPLAEPAK